MMGAIRLLGCRFSSKAIAEAEELALSLHVISTISPIND
jgi:hypothetical protein